MALSAVVALLCSALVALPIFAGIALVSFALEALVGLSVIALMRFALEALMGFLNFAPLLPVGRMLIQPVIVWMNQYSSPATRDGPIWTNAGLGRALAPFLNDNSFGKSNFFPSPHPMARSSYGSLDSGWSRVVGSIKVQDSWPP